MYRSKIQNYKEICKHHFNQPDILHKISLQKGVIGSKFHVAKGILCKTCFKRDKVECERLNVEGVRKKDWPKKPKRPLKPKRAPQQAVEADCDDENGLGLVADGVDEREGGSSSSESSDEENV
ncbi:hypothetical protein EV424DRAFT_1555648 [Suillus variegatus]|nr:hypothetical protein EV424DRAFT_1555648 [Suillus variegatus]